MKRRTFIKGTTTVFSGLGFSAISSTQTQIKKAEQTFDTYVTMEQEKVSFYSDAINEKIKIIHIADTHLYMDDDRGIPFLNYSNRMAKAYNETIHFKTREKTNPKKSFEEALEFAKGLNADVITLIEWPQKIKPKPKNLIELNFEYGKDFFYSEATLCGTGNLGKIKAYLVSFPLLILAMAKPGSFLKKIIDLILPSPGEGPSKQNREAGFFNFRFYVDTCLLYTSPSPRD